VLGKMKAKKLYCLIYLVCLLILTACSNEVDKLVVPIHRTTDNLHTTTEDIDMPNITVIPDTELHFKESKIVLEKKF
jgi:PBP1b-binding outer membrane lipoprotein LpoB